MATLLVHLSDVHLTKDDDSFVNRSQKIADAALSAVTNYEQIHVVVSGDLVQSGQSAEFGVAKKFLAALKAAIEAKANASVHFVLAPGNHECDFTGSQNVRDRLLSGVKGVAEDFEPEIAAEYSRVLSNFFEFREEMSPGVDTKSPWLALYKNCGGSGINYVVLSSSVLSTKSEKQGALFVPVPKSSDISIEGGLTIYVMHHPYNWLSPDNARELAQFAAVSANIFLMGHEHVSVSQKISDLYEDSSVYYLKAHVLKDSKRFLDSEFQTVEIDGEQGFLVRKYRLDGGAYCQVASSEAEKHIAWRQKSTKGPVLAEDAYRRLMDPGANFSHRLKSSLTLPDIYIWPEFRVLMGDRDNGGGYTANSVLSSFEVCVQGYSELQPIVVIKGGEQFGKTALGKMLMLSLCKKGIYPLILAARDVSSWRPRSIEGRLDEIIRSTYGAGSIDCYKQLDNAQKCLIIDDFEFGNLTKGYVDGIKALRQQFGKIIIFLHSQPGMEVAVTEFLLDESFVDSEVYDLQPMSYASRLDMIEKWLLIGRGGVEEVDHVKTSAAKFSKIVDETLGRNLIPPVPLFVIIILQRTELETDLDTVVRSGSHGFLYEALITQSLTKNVNLCTVDTALTYLTEFAGRLYQSGAVVLQQMKYEAFHSEHCAKYDLNIPVRDFQTQMEHAGILKYRDQVVEFKYPYHYYYFIARHLSGFDSWAKLEPHVDGLVSSVHTEKSANILLFLAHLGRNPKIGEKILLHADSILSTYSEADIYKQNALLSKYSFSDVKQILIEGPRSVQIEAHQEDARLSDEMTKELAEIAAEKLESRLHEALALNGAFKTLQVLGQVLRNHSGSTVKEEKRAFAGSCVSLGLRVMGLLIDMVDRHGREMIQFRALQLRAEDGRLTDDDIAQALEQYLPSMVAVNAVGTLIRIGTAIGSEELSPTLDSVLQGDKTRRLIRIITELEHFSKFPEREIKEFKENMIGSQDVLPYAIMRRFLIRRFYLFPSRDELRMSICDSFGIVRRPFIPLVQKKVGYSPNS